MSSSGDTPRTHHTLSSATSGTHQSQTNPAWVRPPDVYTLMGQALYNVRPESLVASKRPDSPPVVRPRPSMNQFYEGSRYFYEAPVEPQEPRCTSCLKCLDKEPNVASYKCYSCAKFDARGKGWFCSACFKYTHPWHREEHHWVLIAEEDDAEYDLVAADYRAELDRTLDGIQGLIDGCKDTRRKCKEMDEDFRPDDMLKENARKLEKNTQRVWDLKHFVRGQVRVAFARIRYSRLVAARAALTS